VLAYFLIGVALGALTGVPIGPVNVAVIDGAYRHTLRRGMAVGLGGAVGDFGFALIGVLGVGPHVIAQPGVKPVLYLVSGIVLMAYGILTVRSQPPPPPTSPPHQSPPGKEVWSGFTVGLGLIVLNPAAMVTWVVVVGSHVGEDIETLEGLAAALGVFIGSLGWFSFVAYVADKGKRMMGDKAVWIARVVGIALVVYGVYSLYRAAALFRG
jgi:threonine/homoserine/homoserine lactone efflux protein